MLDFNLERALNLKLTPEAENILTRAWRGLLAAGQVYTPLTDMSHWNQEPDWAALRTLTPGIVLKATEGSAGLDAKFPVFYPPALSAGFVVSAYHFFRSNVEGVAQANHFWNTIQPLRSALGYIPLLFVDVETTDGTGNSTRMARLKAMVDRLHVLGALGRVGLYTSKGFADANMPFASWINTLHQWIASWTSASLPSVPNQWKPLPELWQRGIWDNHSWIPPIPGCVPDVDYNLFFGNAWDYYAWAGNPLPPPTDPPMPILPQAKCVVSALNVRSQPWVGTNIVGSLVNNEIVKVADIYLNGNEKWIQVQKADKRAGWCAFSIGSTTYCQWI